MLKRWLKAKKKVLSSARFGPTATSDGVDLAPPLSPRTESRGVPIG